MPSDANGVYSLPDGYLAVTGETIQASQHNPPLEDLASAMSQRLMRSGAAPMTGPLKLTDGSTGSPAVQFNSDGTTGFYKTANGIGVAVGGTKVAEFTSGGVNRMLGEIISYTFLSSSDPGVVFPNGQTLSRASYPEMWAKVQTEIANGNALYNNGDGSTTFGICDLRGRVIAGKDNMGGGVAAGRLTSASGITGTTLGAAGGAQTVTLTQGQLPAFKPGITIFDPGHSHVDTGAGSVNAELGSGGIDVLRTAGTHLTESNSTGITAAFTDNLGSGQSHTNVQPTLVCNYLLYVGA